MNISPDTTPAPDATPAPGVFSLQTERYLPGKVLLGGETETEWEVYEFTAQPLARGVHHPVRGVIAIGFADGVLSASILDIQDWDAEIDPFEAHPSIGALTEEIKFHFADALASAISTEIQ